MEDQLKKSDKKTNYAALLALLLLLAVILHYTLGCPVRFVTGISCPGCGMTRAVLCAARLDFAGAFYYHPLFIILPAAVLAYILRRHIPRKLLDYSAAAVCVIVIAVYIVRLLDPACDIVTFQPQDGLMYRVFHR